LLLHAEQGLGDTIQMARFIPAIAATSRVVLQVQPALRRLLAGFGGVAGVCSRGEAVPEFAVQCALPDLPGVVGTTLLTIPGTVPYLHAEPDAVAYWQRRVAALGGRRVGLAWAGNPGFAADRRRSIAPEALAALAGLPDVAFVSLQKCSLPRRCRCATGPRSCTISPTRRR
jgi:hypothetical protein